MGFRFSALLSSTDEYSSAYGSLKEQQYYKTTFHKCIIRISTFMKQRLALQKSCNYYKNNYDNFERIGEK